MFNSEKLGDRREREISDGCVWAEGWSAAAPINVTVLARPPSVHARIVSSTSVLSPDSGRTSVHSKYSTHIPDVSVSSRPLFRHLEYSK